MDPARSAAFKILLKTELDRAWSGPLMRELKLTDQKDSDFCRFIIKTVQERLLTLDYNISLYLNKPIKNLSPKVLTVFRIGAAQLLYSESIPPSAAVNESVILAKNNGCGFASGLINAVLRKIAINGIRFPEITDLNYNSIKYSVSRDVFDTLYESYKENTESVLSFLTSGKPSVLYLRKNTLISGNLSVNHSETPIKNCYVLNNKSGFTESSDFRRGAFHIQDLSSQIACAVLDPKPDETVADVCSAPGGKTATLAQMMNNSGRIFAFDIYEHKINLINENLNRLGITIVNTAIRDASEGCDLPLCDKIICDVPCSGLGVIRKKPEIRYKKFEEINSLPAMQFKILERSSSFLKSGGSLVYSTCTLNRKENHDVVHRFLQLHPEFFLYPIDPFFKGQRDNEMLTVLPYDYDSDGFFIALLKKQ